MSATLSVTRRFEWDSMHRIPNHESVCRAFHGHRYAAEIVCAAPALDQVGRIIDFSLIKQEIGSWIDRNFDHTAILQRDDDDPAIRAIVATNAGVGKPVYFLDGPPTVENIVQELARHATALMAPYNITVEQIRIWETPNCSTTWTRA
jgi:6-pyruvoyltetrahydropterin/6-carboxytetrahydropterin synthase